MKVKVSVVASDSNSWHASSFEVLTENEDSVVDEPLYKMMLKDINLHYEQVYVKIDGG